VASLIPDASVSIHYVEYNSDDTQFLFQNGVYTGFIDGRNTQNTPKGKIYDQSSFVGGELPKFFGIANPSDIES
jgi:hypothetical protein